MKSLLSKDFLNSLLLVLPVVVVDMGMNSYLGYMMIVFFIALNKPYFSPRKLSNLALAVLVISVAAFFRIFQYTGPMFKEVGLMLLAVSPALFHIKVKLNVKLLNLVLLAGLLVLAGKNIFSINLSLDAFLHSDTGIEFTIIAFLFPLFSIYWFKKGRYGYALANFFFTVIAGKRIAMGATLVACAACWFFRGKVQKGKSVGLGFKLFILAGLSSYILVIILFANGVFDDFIHSLTGLTANQITMGRQTLYTNILSEGNLIDLFGQGPAKSSLILEKFSNINKLHSDILKVYVENGLLLFWVFFGLLLRNLKYNKLPYILFIFIVFLTDNTLIYVSDILFYSFFLDEERFFETRQSILQQLLIHKKKTVLLSDTIHEEALSISSSHCTL